MTKTRKTGGKNVGKRAQRKSDATPLADSLQPTDKRPRRLSDEDIDRLIDRHRAALEKLAEM